VRLITFKPLQKKIALWGVLVTLFTLISGCSSYGAISNTPTEREKTQTADTIKPDYSIQTVLTAKPQGNVALVLTFSGGGTRAAALAYGVLQALYKTEIGDEHHKRPLLNEVDVISSVSGGSFLAAYYGLHGKETFESFESIMLKKDIKSELISGILSPANWFLDTGRTEMAVQFYNNTIFKDATFKDLQKADSPLILINATDLGNGVRFSFTQDSFNLICSDINQFSIARAVTASSAVPVMFNPVVVKNYQPCQNATTQKLAQASQNPTLNYELKQVIKGLQDYTQTEYPYLHLVDGGISDNLGLRAIYESVELSGGAKRFLTKIGKQSINHIAVISVDASTQSARSIRFTNKAPSIEDSVDAMTDIQLHRYNNATLQVFESSLDRWGKALSTPNNPVSSHFIKLNFNQLPTEEQRTEFNQIPTSLSLTEDQVHSLIQAGHDLLISNPLYQDLVKKLSVTPQ